MAYEFYITIEGTKQGKFKGESLREKWNDRIAGISFSYEVKSSRDTAGKPSGKRQHNPITIVKQWGASSPQIFQALVTNELLKTVLFEFVRTNSNGEEEIFHIIRLTNAFIVNYHPYINHISHSNVDNNEIEDLEEVSFAIQKIEIENKVGKTMASGNLKSS